MSNLVYITIQALLAVVGVRLLVGGVFSRIARIQHPEIATDIWGPIALVAPMMVMVGRVRGDVGGIGWIVVGGPMLCASLALGIGMLGLRAGAESAYQPPRPRAVTIWIVAGVIYLLLSIAHNLSVWTGQALFAVGAVLLWFNTPDGGPIRSSSGLEEMRAGTGMTLGAICAFGQGAAACLASDSWAGISGAMMIAYAAIVLAATARVAGTDVAVRVGGWAATFGLIFSLGLMSLLFMLPTVVGVFEGVAPAPTTEVAYGFGAYAFEAMGLLILGSAAMFLHRIPARRRRMVGGAVLLAAAAVAAWRLMSIPLVPQIPR